MDLKKYIWDVQDFPIKGITFKDITPVLNDIKAFKYTVDQMSEYVKSRGANVIVAPEARGFVFASAVAYVTGCRFVLVRKPNKLPRKVKDIKYDLEYGSGHIQIHEDDLKANDKVVIIDDVLATGGTMEAIINLVEDSDASVEGIVFLADITSLHKPEIFDKYDWKTLVSY